MQCGRLFYTEYYFKRFSKYCICVVLFLTEAKCLAEHKPVEVASNRGFCVQIVFKHGYRKPSSCNFTSLVPLNVVLLSSSPKPNGNRPVRATNRMAHQSAYGRWCLNLTLMDL